VYTQKHAAHSIDNKWKCCWVHEKSETWVPWDTLAALLIAHFCFSSLYLLLPSSRSVTWKSISVHKLEGRLSSHFESWIESKRALALPQKLLQLVLQKPINKTMNTWCICFTKHFELTSVWSNGSESQMSFFFHIGCLDSPFLLFLFCLSDERRIKDALQSFQVTVIMTLERYLLKAKQM